MDLQGELRTNDEEIRSKLSKEVYQVVCEIVGKHFKISQVNCNLRLEALSGDNFIGVLYRLLILTKTNKSRSFIIKVPPTCDARRKLMHARNCFLREIFFYEKVFPVFKNFQLQNLKLDGSEGFHEVLKCLGFTLSESEEGIFLEDLKNSENGIYDHCGSITAQHVKLLMKTLGKLHAISFAIKDQQPELLAKFAVMKDNLVARFCDKSVKTSCSFRFIQKALEVLELSSNSYMVANVKLLLKSDFGELLASCVDGVKAEPYSVLCHGDISINNMMFKHDRDGTPNDICLIDWQNLRYASPITDLVYYLFGYVEKDLREKYYEEFLDLYYGSLSSLISRLGSNPDKLFPRNIFREQLKSFGKHGLLMAILTLPFSANKQDQILERLSESPLKNHYESQDKQLPSDVKITFNETYATRMIDVFNDVWKYGYI